MAAAFLQEADILERNGRQAEAADKRKQANALELQGNELTDRNTQRALDAKLEREGRTESARQFDLTNTRAYKEADENLKLQYDTLHSKVEQADLDRIAIADQNELNLLAKKYEVDQPYSSNTPR